MCGGKGSLLNLILLIDKTSADQAFKTIKEFSSVSSLIDQRKTLTERSTTAEIDFKLPSEAKNELFDLHRDYLTDKRNLDAEYIFKKYKLKCKKYVD